MSLQHKLEKVKFLKREYGLKYVAKRTAFRVKQRFNPLIELDYEAWRKQNQPNAFQVKRQREYAARMKEDKTAPVFVAVMDTEGKSEAMIARTKLSLAFQTFRPEKVFIGKMSRMAPRFNNFYEHHQGRDIWLIKICAGDIVAADFFYRVARAIEDNSEVDIWYTDHEEYVENEKPRVYLKPDFSKEYLCAYNYIGRSFVSRCSQEEEGFMSSYQYLMKRLSEGAVIGHIPKCIFGEKQDDVEKRVKTEEELALEKEFIDKCIRAVYEKQKDYKLEKIDITQTKEGTRNVKLTWSESPFVSVIIPNKDHVEDLEVCLRSLTEQTIFDDIEIIIVENNSTDPKTFAYYEWLINGYEGYYFSEADDKELWQKLRARVRVLVYDKGFNYSAINNFAEREAEGEFILLLNNDVELYQRDALEIMRSSLMMDGVGMVGAKLLYDDDTVQHGGVVVGFKGVAGHSFTGLLSDNPGYMNMSICTRRVSAVTAACLMVRKAVYDEVGGLDERYAVAFNDVDFCLKVDQTGAAILYQPMAAAYHYESKTRGLDTTKSQQKRFAGEISTFINTWREWLLEGDPYYNVNMSLQSMEGKYREVYFADDWY